MAQSTRRIVWLHGWGMNARIWERLASAFPGAQHHFISYAGCAAADDFRRALRSVLDAPGGGGTPWTLVGWSLGGMLALEEAFRGAVRLDSLVLVGSTLRFVSEDRRKGWPRRIVERMRKQLHADPEQTLRQFAASLLSEGERELCPPALPQALIEPQGPLQAEAFIQAGKVVQPQPQSQTWPQPPTQPQLSPLGRGADSTDFTMEGLDAGLAYLLETDLTASWQSWRQLAQSFGIAAEDRPRLLWLHGGADAVCPPDGVPVLAADELVWLEGAGHAPMVTQPERMAGLLRRFWHEYR